MYRYRAGHWRTGTIVLEIRESRRHVRRDSEGINVNAVEKVFPEATCGREGEMKIEYMSVTPKELFNPFPAPLRFPSRT